MSKSATKAPIEPERARRIVDIPRFSSRPIPARSAFVADLDTPPPRVATGAPPAPRRHPQNNFPGAGTCSESVAKAPRGGIGGERRCAISTILLRRSGSVGAFATDSDKRRREPLGRQSRAGRRPRRSRRAPRSTATTTSTTTATPRKRRRGPRAETPRLTRTSLNPRERTSSRRSRGLSDVLAGYPAISAVK